MQANDTALDAIGDGNRIKRIVRDKDKKALKKLLENFSRPESVLGVVEFILDADTPHTFFDTCRPIIDKAFDEEKGKIECWDQPEERRRALNVFKKRLQGKKVPQNDTNEGLLTKIMRADNG